VRFSCKWGPVYAALENMILQENLMAAKDEALSRHATWAIGGPADYVVYPDSVDQVVRLVGMAHTERIPWIVIGKGSNLLFSDHGFRGLVIQLDRQFARVALAGHRVHAQCGVSVPRLAHRAALAGLSGLEHTVGIPGSLGGLVAINGGSLQCAIGDVVRNVTFITSDGTVETISRDACNFSYRHSRFLLSGCIVASVELELRPGDRRTIHQTMYTILRDRRRAYPLRWPNCGSVFRSLPQWYAAPGPPGKLIEACGLKGLARGPAVVSDQHANFIINRGGATARDILGLIGQIRHHVHRYAGVWLECEVIYVHAQGRMEPAHQVLLRD